MKKKNSLLSLKGTHSSINYLPLLFAMSSASILMPNDYLSDETKLPDTICDFENSYGYSSIAKYFEFQYTYPQNFDGKQLNDVLIEIPIVKKIKIKVQASKPLEPISIENNKGFI
ncbi:MAG: hypothetical protein HND52_10460 [Ignavibacteriae bacterium]|nr:hypothetical protein [Ignavibacteriota bacterium]NOG98370.1 hypothetical protein [Ignavibacteriota bacterium]